MITELNLSGSELLIYGLLYGLTQSQEYYNAHLNFLAGGANTTKTNAKRVVDKLLEKGYIERLPAIDEMGNNCYKYRATPSVYIECLKKEQERCIQNDNTQERCIQNDNGGCIQNDNTGVYKMNTQINNNINNIDSNIYSVCDESQRTQESQHQESSLNIKKEEVSLYPPSSAAPPKRFAKPTISDIKDYCWEKGYSIDAERFFDYYESNGWKVGRSPMKDWKAAVRNWARQENEKQHNRHNYGRKQDDFDAARIVEAGNALAEIGF